MNSILESRLGMYDSVRTLANDNATAIATIPALQTAFDEYTDLHDAIRVLVEAEGRPSKPSTAQKKQARKKLQDEIFKIAGLIKAYATTNEWEDLQAASHLVKSNFYRITDEELPALSRRIMGLATDNLAGLADYGVDAARIAAFSALHDDYEAKAMAPKAAISNRQSAKAQLKDKTGQCDLLLNNRIDNLMKDLMTDFPGFYYGYFAARKVYDNPSRQTTLRIEVRDTVGNPVPKVLVSIPEIETQDITDDEGIVEFKPIPNGTYDLTAAKEGYKTAFLSGAQTRLGKRVTFVIIIEVIA